MFTNKKVLYICIVLAAFVFSFLVSVVAGTLFTSIDAGITDRFFHIRYQLGGKEQVSPFLCVFNLDDRDFDALNITPSDRNIFDEAIVTLSNAGVDTIAFDIIFKNENSGKSDEALIDTLRQTENVFLPIVKYFGSKNSSVVPASGGTIRKAIWFPEILSPGNPETIAEYLAPFDGLAEVSRGLGAVDFSSDEDGVVRKASLLFSCGKGYLPSLILAAIAHYLKVDDRNIEVDFGRSIKLSGAELPNGIIKDVFIPIDTMGRMKINYAAPYDDPIKSFPLRELIDFGRNPGQFEDSQDMLSGTLVILSDISSRNTNNITTVFDPLVPHNEILVHALNTILTENYIRVAPFFSGANIWLLSILILPLLLMVVRYNAKVFVLLSAAVYGVFLFVSFFLFIHDHLTTGYSALSTGFFLSVTGIVLYNYLRVIREKHAGERAYAGLKKRSLMKEKELTTSMQARIEQLENNSRAREEHFAHVAREVKNPLTLIENLLESGRDKSNRSSMTIKGCVKGLKQIILTLLNPENMENRKALSNPDQLDQSVESDNPRGSSGEPGNIDSGKSTVLVVEDNPDMAAFLKLSMKEKYNIILKTNGEEALLEMTWGIQPDLILSDVQMDKMDGFAFCNELRNHDKFKTIPFIFLSASSLKEDRLHGLSLGAVDYIAKPFQIEDLMARIGTILHFAKIQKEASLEEFEKKISGLLKEEKRDNFLQKYKLNYKEKEVALLIKEGLLDKEIAEQLKLSIYGVKKRNRSIYKKCEVNGRVDLVNLLNKANRV